MKRIWLALVAVTLLVLTGISPALAGNFYVSLSGNNSNTGTGAGSSTAWRTIQFGTDHLPLGSTLLVLPGFYPENVVITNPGSVTGPKLITAYSPTVTVSSIAVDASYWTVDSSIHAGGPTPTPGPTPSPTPTPIAGNLNGDIQGPPTANYHAFIGGVPVVNPTPVATPAGPSHFAFSPGGSAHWDLDPTQTPTPGPTPTASPTPILVASGGGTGSSVVPSSGQVPIGNVGGTAYAPKNISGDCSLSSTGAMTCPLISGISPGGTCGSHNWVSSINSSAVPACTQPAFGDVSGSVTVLQITSALSSPPPIGGGTPNTGTFTALTDSALSSGSNSCVQAGTSGQLSVTGFPCGNQGNVTITPVTVSTTPITLVLPANGQSIQNITMTTTSATINIPAGQWVGQMMETVVCEDATGGWVPTFAPGASQTLVNLASFAAACSTWTANLCHSAGWTYFATNKWILNGCL